MSLLRVPALRRADGTLSALPRLAVIAVGLAGAAAATIDPFTFGFYVSYALVGVYLAIRRPSNAVSWLLIVIAFGFLGTTSVPTIDTRAVVAGRGSLRDELLSWVGAWSAYATFLGFAALAIVYPTGHLPGGRRSRRLAIVGLALGVTAMVATAVAPTIGVASDPSGVTHVQAPNPFALLPPETADIPIADVSIFIVLLLVVAGVAGLLLRYRRSTGILRLQFRWLLASFVAVLIGITVGLLGSLFEPASQGIEWVPAIIAYPTVPAAVAVAVLRYRLFEIDRIVNRAVVYGAITAILAGVFAAAIAVTQRVFIALTGERSEAAIVLVTLIVAALYVPVRKRTEAVVDRYLKYEDRWFGAYRSDLGHLLDLVDPVRAAQRLANEAVRETGASGAAVVDEGGRVIATAGTWTGAWVVEVPIGDGGANGAGSDSSGSILARVRLAARSDGRPIGAGVLAALGDVAKLATAAIPPGANAGTVASTSWTVEPGTATGAYSDSVPDTSP